MPMIIDLTMEVSEKIPPFPGDPKAIFENIATIAKHDCNERRFSINSHFSTHIDSPYHMLEEGKKLEEFPPETFFGDATIIDVRNISKITKVYMPKKIMTQFLLFYTGHSDNIRSPDYFKKNPVLTPDAAEEIIKHGVKIVGIDSFTPDNYPYTFHKILFRKNILILENLINLSRLKKHCKLYIAPLNLINADGAPTRVFAKT